MSKPYCVIVFDFDGVIVESQEIKDAAFAEAFKGWAEHTEAIMRYHLANHAVSRYNKFDYVFREIIGIEPSAEQLAAIADGFNEFCFREIVACREVPGAESCLAALAASAPLYLVSATPLAELLRIVEARGLGQYFREVAGAPEGKPEIFRRILDGEGILPGEAVYVGDSLSDYVAAREVGLDFVGRRREDEFPPDCEHIFDDLNGVLSHLHETTPTGNH